MFCLLPQQGRLSLCTLLPSTLFCWETAYKRSIILGCSIPQHNRTLARSPKNCLASCSSLVLLRNRVGGDDSPCMPSFPEFPVIGNRACEGSHANTLSDNISPNRNGLPLARQKSVEQACKIPVLLRINHGVLYVAPFEGCPLAV